METKQQEFQQTTSSTTFHQIFNIKITNQVIIYFIFAMKILNQGKELLACKEFLDHFKDLHQVEMIWKIISHRDQASSWDYPCLHSPLCHLVSQCHWSPDAHNPLPTTHNPVLWLVGGTENWALIGWHCPDAGSIINVYLQCYHVKPDHGDKWS